jgi:hypothetical protein
MKLQLLLDVDGVLLDWVHGLTQFIQLHVPDVQINLAPPEPGVYLHDHLGIRSAKLERIIDQFHVHDAFGELNALPGTIQALNILAPFCDISCITACGTHARTQELRRKNLLHHFGDIFDHIHCTDTFDEKDAYLSQYVPGFWVEDHASNALLGLTHAHTCFLMETPFNTHMSDPDLIPVQNMAHMGMIMLSQSRSRFL